MAQRKTSTNRKKSNSANKTYRAPDALSKATLKLIDRAAEGLKDGIISGAKRGAKGRQILKKKAFSLVTMATKRLNEAIREGSTAIRKGLKKL